MTVIEGVFEGDELVTRPVKSALFDFYGTAIPRKTLRCWLGISANSWRRDVEWKNAPFLTEDCFGTRLPVSGLLQALEANQ
jgi:hypothetical protein